MNKQKLELDFDYRLFVFGLSSGEREYKLAWLINRATDIQLSKEKDFEMELKQPHNLMISNFKFETEHCIFRLLKNRLISDDESSRAFLVKDLRSFEYLMTVDDQSDSFDAQSFLEQLKTIPELQLITSVDLNKLKDKENLIL